MVAQIWKSIDWNNDAMNVQTNTEQSIHKTSTHLELEMHPGRKGSEQQWSDLQSKLLPMKQIPELKGLLDIMTPAFPPISDVL